MQYVWKRGVRWHFKVNYSRNNDILLCRLNDLKIIDENMSKYAPQERPKNNIQGNVGLNCIM